ncbi:MAG: hypothetical protein BAJALOKI3v1_50013 [Promethearchaeota archaeon]|nr:MAG: hypothetical protein BAJALOKI3v1_50013 [Candidatus Lokiarchaeota archaeon]
MQPTDNSFLENTIITALAEVLDIDENFISPCDTLKSCGIEQENYGDICDFMEILEDVLGINLGNNIFDTDKTIETIAKEILNDKKMFNIQ